MAVSFQGNTSQELQMLENRFNAIVERIIEYHPDPDLLKLRRAFDYGIMMHNGQFRKSGEAYIWHPLEVCDILVEFKQDIDTLIAGLLHDTVEDTEATLEDLTERFGEVVSFLVDGVTKISKVKGMAPEIAQAETLRKIISASHRDFRVILIKLADRLHNMRTLKHMSANSQKRISSETMEIYAPIANRMGMGWVKTELQELAFSYLHYDEYLDIAKKVSQRRRERESYVREVIGILRDALDESGIQCTIDGRPKSLWSIRQKMVQKNISFDDIYDVQGFRVIVDDESRCYEAIGIIHCLWKPIKGRFKDYIANPKANNYRSLHTSVYGPKGEPIEVQVRSKEMHKDAEEGVAAHWAYKEKQKKGGKDDVYISWMDSLVSDASFKEEKGEDLIENVKSSLISDTILVFTPKGEAKTLPAGATVLDFAYLVHTEIGHTCTGAMVNGSIASIRQQLHSMDTVQIITAKKQKPKREWLECVVTGGAKSKIKRFLRDRERERSYTLGRETLDKELRKKGSALASIEKGDELQRYIESSKYHSEFDLFVEIGFGKVPLSTLVSKLLGLESESEEIAPIVEELESEPEDQLLLLRPTLKVWKAKAAALRRSNRMGIEIDGVPNPKVQFASCCRPLPPQEIVGYVTIGRGLSVHVKGCEKIKHFEPARLHEARWLGLPSDKKHKVRLNIQSVANSDMLAKIAGIMADAKVDITANSSYINQDAKTRTHILDVNVINETHLRDVTARLKRNKGVLKITQYSDTEVS